MPRSKASIRQASDHPFQRFEACELSSAGSHDLVESVAERLEHPVVQPGAAGFHEEVGIDELPDHLAVGGDLEEGPVAVLAGERVAVGQALGARDVRLKKSNSDWS